MLSIDPIFSATTSFSALEREVWEFQRAQNPVLSRFANLIAEKNPVPLPIRFFKDFEMKTGEWNAEAVFESSGTTGVKPSRHFIRSVDEYRRVSLTIFRSFFGDEPRLILALLPGYLARGNSSLVQMVKFLIEEFGIAGSGFYLSNFAELDNIIRESAEKNEPVFLLGVTHALIDFAEMYPRKLPLQSVVMETGGMKGRKKEMLREEVHSQLKSAFAIPKIASEYGMTELMSQAYSLENGRFFSPHWMKISIRDPWLPTRILAPGQNGRIAITDLANLHSCAFILTDDLGKMHTDGSFEVLGRIDNSELRGCNLMYN